MRRTIWVHGILVFIFCTLLSSSAFAVGFANLPSVREVVFSPGADIEIPLAVVGGSNIDVNLNALTPGDPSTLGTAQDNNILEYVHIIDASPGTGERALSVRFSFPQAMKPGIYYIDMYATDNPPNRNQAMITAVASVKLRFTVRVLSSEKLLEITSIGVPPIAEGLPANVSLGVISRTTSTLDNVRATFFVWDKESLLLTVDGPASIRLDSAQSAVISSSLPVDSLSGGEYTVNATVSYDGNTASSNPATLRIGTLHVDVRNHTPSLAFNATNKFTFNIVNQWNRELREVNAKVTLNGQTKKTASLNIPPFGSTIYEIYFDRDASLIPGTASVSVEVVFKDFDPISGGYQEKTEQFSLPVLVQEPPVLEQPSAFSSLLLPVSIGMVLLIVLLTLIVAYVRRSHEDPQVNSAQHPSPLPPQPSSQPSSSSQLPSLQESTSLGNETAREEK